MTTEDQIVERYGTLLSIDDLSELLKRSPNGLRVSLHGQSKFASQWNRAKKKIGRRVYFRARDVAVLIDED